MAYATGSSSDIDDLINVKLKAFAVANGWAVNDNNWPNFLALSKGTCFVNLRRYGSGGGVSGNNTFTDAYGNTISDNRLKLHISSGYNGVPATPDARYSAQPNAAVTSTTDGDAIWCNDLSGPFTAYHFFSGSGSDPAYIHVAVETRAGYFTHFSFGETDRLNMTFTPRPAYVDGSFYQHWPSSTTLTSRYERYWDSNNVHNAYMKGSEEDMHAYIGGADSTELVKIDHQIMTNYEVLGSLDGIVSGANNGFFATCVFNLGPNPLNNVTPLIPIPIFVDFPTNSDAFFPLGTVPNMRFCSMKNRQAGEEVTLGSDTWKLFPMRRKRDDGGTVPTDELVNAPPYENTSGYYGVAIKKVS